MTEVAFHFGAADKVAYASRLLRKATGAGARVLVLSEPKMAQSLDIALWNVSATDFVAHTLHPGPEMLESRSSVLIAQSVPDRDAVPSICVNLGQPVPEQLERFSRVIEVVSTDDEDRHSARGRWKHYAAQGLTITRHDLALKGAGA